MTIPTLQIAPPAQNDIPQGVPEPIPHEEIEVRAYFRYVNRGCVDGFALEDWLDAERELRDEADSRNIAAAA